MNLVSSENDIQKQASPTFQRKLGIMVNRTHFTNLCCNPVSFTKTAVYFRGTEENET